MSWKVAFAMHIVMDGLWSIVLPSFGYYCMCNDMIFIILQFKSLLFVILFK